MRSDSDLLRGVRETARFLRCRNEEAARLIAEGAFPSRRVGGAALVSKRAVLAWLESRNSGEPLEAQ